MSHPGDPYAQPSPTPAQAPSPQYAGAPAQAPASPYPGPQYAAGGQAPYGQPGVPTGQYPQGQGPYGAPQPGFPGAPQDPGKSLGVAGLVLAFVCTIVGLILSIVAFRRSKAAGFRNTVALWGIVLSSVFLGLALIGGGLVAVGALTFAAHEGGGDPVAGIKKVASDASFCSDYKPINDDFLAFGSTDPSTDAEGYVAAALKVDDDLHSFTPPAEIADEWAKMTDGIDVIAEPLKAANPTTPEGVQDALAPVAQQVMDASDDLTTAGDAIDDYAVAHCNS